MAGHFFGLQILTPLWGDLSTRRGTYWYGKALRHFGKVEETVQKNSLCALVDGPPYQTKPDVPL